MDNNIEFARFVNGHILQLINHTDTKTTIIVAINGVLLGLLFGSFPRGLLQGSSNVPQLLFISIIFLLGASAVLGLLAIFPRIDRNLI